MNIQYTLLLIFHTVFVSVPEQLFLILFSLILINRQEFFTILNKSNALRLMVISVIPAIVSVLLRTVGGFNMNFMPFIGIAVIVVVIALGYKIMGVRKVGILLGSVIVSFICEMGFQLIFVSLALYGTSASIESLNEPGFISFVWSLPLRTLETVLISVILLNKISVNKIKLFIVIWRNKFLTWIFLMIIIFDFIIIYSFAKSIFLDRSFVELDPLIQISILVCGITIPVITTSVFLIITYMFAERKKDEQTFMISEAKVLKELINLLIRDGRYQEISDVMNDYNLLVENCGEYMERKGLKV